MARAGPFSIPDPLKHVPSRPTPVDPPEVLLPARRILDAGLREFERLARLNWPNRAGDGLVQFDMRNPQQMLTVLGLVYMAMRKVDKR